VFEFEVFENTRTNITYNNLFIQSNHTQNLITFNTGSASRDINNCPIHLKSLLVALFVLHQKNNNNNEINRKKNPIKQTTTTTKKFIQNKDEKKGNKKC
jgi:hypothetical protein